MCQTFWCSTVDLMHVRARTMGYGYGIRYTTQVAKYPTFCRVNALHRETKGETIPIFLPCKRKTKVGYGTLLVYLTCAFTR